jgi:hypothetical protein
LVKENEVENTEITRGPVRAGPMSTGKIKFVWLEGKMERRFRKSE